MDVLIALKSFRLSGEQIQPGDKIRIETDNDVQFLIARGYARPLTKEEVKSILDEYIAEAKNVFKFPVEKTRKGNHERPQQGLWDKVKP